MTVANTASYSNQSALITTGGSEIEGVGFRSWWERRDWEHEHQEH